MAPRLVLERWNLGDLFGDEEFRCCGFALADVGEENFLVLMDLGLPDAALTGDWAGLKVEFSLILRKADGDGKLVSLLKLTELSLPTDRAELNPLELDVRFPRPVSRGEY